MVSATFIFRRKQYDDEFRRLDRIIEETNLKNPEYLGMDSWQNTEKNLLCVVYYYKSMAGLVELRAIAAHQEAKSKYTKWYDGYHIVVSEVVRSYGDGFITHPTPAVEY